MRNNNSAQVLRLLTSRPPDDVRSRIGRVITMARLMSGKIQAEFANAMGVSQSWLSKVESGELQPHADQWMLFCQRTEISPWCFLDQAELENVETRFRSWVEKTHSALLDEGEMRLLDCGPSKAKAA